MPRDLASMAICDLTATGCSFRPRLQIRTSLAIGLPHFERAQHLVSFFLPVMRYAVWCRVRVEYRQESGQDLRGSPRLAS
jgi:hypothetical protein